MALQQPTVTLFPQAWPETLSPAFRGGSSRGRLLLAQPQALQSPGEILRQGRPQLSGGVSRPRAWEEQAVQVQVQGQLCGLGGGQAETSEEGFIQGLGGKGRADLATPTPGSCTLPASLPPGHSSSPSSLGAHILTVVGMVRGSPSHFSWPHS